MPEIKKSNSFGNGKRPRVVFDVKMPSYGYRNGEEHSLSVDRKRETTLKLPTDCLSNLKA